jgi:hypothetical protein
MAEDSLMIAVGGGEVIDGGFPPMILDDNVHNDCDNVHNDCDNVHNDCDNVHNDCNQSMREMDHFGDELNANVCDKEKSYEEKASTTEIETYFLSPKHLRPNEIPLKRCLSENDMERRSLFLELLPPEIFLKICSYLHAKFVIGTLTRVCRQFRDLLVDDATWKIRIAKRYPKKYPVVPGKDCFICSVFSTLHVD